MPRTIGPQLTAPIARQRMKNAATSSISGAMGAGDRNAGASMPLFTDNPHTSNDYVYRWRQYVMMYETSWEARKIIRIPVEDALRKGWVAEGIDEKVGKAIMKRLEKLQFMNVLSRSLMLERLLGGCLTFMGLEGTQEETMEKEYKPTRGEALRFCNAIPISRIARVDWDTNPLSACYMRPEKFLINGQTIHTSRCLVWDGDPLFDPYDFALTNFRSNISGFGPSKLAPLWDDIVKAVGTRQAAYQLIQTSNVMMMMINDLTDVNSGSSGPKVLAKLREVVNQMSLYRAAMLDGDKVDVKQHAASFGSVPELIITYLQVLSAASDIPATRFLGQAPGGLNATGESDLENYYNTIDAYQKQRIVPQLRRMYDIIGYAMFPNLWKTEREKLEITFPPMWNADELEEADLETKNIDNAFKLFDAGLIDEVKMIEILNSKKVLGVTFDQVDESVVSELRDKRNGLPEPPEPGAGGDNGTGEGAPLPFGQNPKPADAKKELEILKNSAGILTEFEKGMQVEREHDDITGGDPKLIEKIVRAHLAEDPQYYTKLAQVENAKAIEPYRGYFIGLDDEPESGARGMWQIFDSAHRVKAVDGEAVYRTKRDAKSAVDQAIEGKKQITNALDLKDLNTAFQWKDRQAAILSACVRFGRGLTLDGACSETMEEAPERGFAVGIQNMTNGAYQAFKREVRDHLIRYGYTDGDEAAKRRLLNSPVYPAVGEVEAREVHGLKVDIENPKGSLRSSKDPENPWTAVIPADYGYIKKTEGADGDEVDVYVGDLPESELVFVVDQIDLNTKAFDEHKCIFGCLSMLQAKELYIAGFSDGKGEQRIDRITPVHVDQFKQWLKTGDTKSPFAVKPSRTR